MEKSEILYGSRPFDAKAKKNTAVSENPENLEKPLPKK